MWDRSLFPGITPNIGALANVASLEADLLSLKGVENEDGTITIPDNRNEGRVALVLSRGQLQNMYMACVEEKTTIRGYSQCLSSSVPVQTGTTTFDPEA